MAFKHTILTFYKFISIMKIVYVKKVIVSINYSDKLLMLYSDNEYVKIVDKKNTHPNKSF